MVNNEWDDILFWENYKPCYEMLQELERKYGDDPANWERWHREHYDFYKQTIPNKEEFIRRFEYYELHGKPHWIEGHHRTMNELTKEELLDSIRHVTKENGEYHVEVLEKARQGWAAQHLAPYAEKVCSATSEEHKIMEMTVGAGVGTNAIVRSMTDKMFYAGVDIDFYCAKNADAIGICASLWNLPFSDNLFDVVCSHFGFDECR